MTFLLPLPLQKGELVEVPQTILVLALFLFSIIEMNWILRAEKECGVGGSCGVRIVSFCVSSPFFGQNGAYMRECLGVCIAFHVHCVVPCPCQAPHTDQTLSLSGSAGCRDRAGKLHKKKTGHRFYCFCALMSFFFCCRCKPWPCGGFGIQHFICHMPFLPHIVLSSSKCAGARGWKREVKKKNRKKRWCSKDRAARGG